jgi:hypothetical protein
MAAPSATKGEPEAPKEEASASENVPHPSRPDADADKPKDKPKTRTRLPDAPLRPVQTEEIPKKSKRTASKRKSKVPKSPIHHLVHHQAHERAIGNGRRLHQTVHHQVHETATEN